MSPASQLPMMISPERTSLRDGTQLAFLAAGPASGRRIVLLHGIPTGAELWRQIVPILAERGYRCLAPDLPGYGRTRLPSGSDYSIFAAARRLAEWMEVEDLHDVWLVGHDWGGAVAQVIGSRHPDRLSSLTLSNCPIKDSWPVTPIRLFRWFARRGLYSPFASIGLIPNPYATNQLDRAFYDRTRVPKDTWRRVFWDTKVSDKLGRVEFQRHLAALDNSQTLEIATELKSIGLPTLLIWGANDRFQPWEEVGVRLRDLLPDPEAKLIERAGHFHVLEKPKAFVRALLDWHEGSEEATE